MSGPDHLAAAIDAIGSCGIKWLLALESEPLSNPAETVAGLSDPQRAALEALSQLIGHAGALAGQNRQALWPLVGQQLVGHPSVAAVPPALLIRQASGGSLPMAPDAEDALARSAGAMAVQLLGAYLVDPALDSDRIGSPLWASTRSRGPRGFRMV